MQRDSIYWKYVPPQLKDAELPWIHADEVDSVQFQVSQRVQCLASIRQDLKHQCMSSRLHMACWARNNVVIKLGDVSSTAWQP